jgi:CMP-N-acetylneuraminate monooxygenase
MFKDLGFLKNQPIIKSFSIDIKDLKNDLNFYQDFIILKTDSKIKVFDRNCDHAGGKLIQNQNNYNTVCPIHGWVFNPLSGYYDNGVKKKELPFVIKNKKINFNINNSIPKISKLNKDGENFFSIKYYNHAFLIIEGKNFKFATDPWAIGPAFNNGWWLKENTEHDWLKEVNKCDFIYLSHNHPDHLNTYTLKKISKNIEIVVPKFQHDSMGGLIKNLGFKKINYLQFNREYNFKNSNLIISLLKSGDFRLDSGIYFSIGKFSGLLDVDSNSINFSKIPNVDLYGSSYAGGASGYPLMFDNYSLDEKKKITIKKNLFLKSIKIKNIIKSKSKYFLPYAGSFEEKLTRDKFVKKYNTKINFKDYFKHLEKKNIEVLEHDKFKIFEFNNGRLINKKKRSLNLYKDKSQHYYLKKFNDQNNKISDIKIKNYFLKSNFQDNLILLLSLTDYNFKKIYATYYINFKNKKIEFKKIDLTKLNIKNNKNKERLLLIKSRKESLINTIKNKQPWEDLLIGFQCKIYRKPNLFNSNFWYHFSNIYIKNENKKFYRNCSTCDIFKQKVDNLLYHSTQ